MEADDTGRILQDSRREHVGKGRQNCKGGGHDPPLGWNQEPEAEALLHPPACASLLGSAGPLGDSASSGSNLQGQRGKAGRNRG